MTDLNASSSACAPHTASVKETGDSPRARRGLSPAPASAPAASPPPSNLRRPIASVARAPFMAMFPPTVMSREPADDAKHPIQPNMMPFATTQSRYLAALAPRPTISCSSCPKGVGGPALTQTKRLGSNILEGRLHGDEPLGRGSPRSFRGCDGGGHGEPTVSVILPSFRPCAGRR